MLHLPSCAKEGFRGKIGNFCFTLTQTLHSLGVCITQEEIFFFSTDCCYCLDSSSIDESKIHIHSFSILLYQSS